MKFSLIVALAATLGGSMPQGVSGQVFQPFFFPSQFTWKQVHGKYIVKKFCDNHQPPSGAAFCMEYDFTDKLKGASPPFQDDLTNKLGYPNYSSMPSKPIGFLDNAPAAEGGYSGEMFVMFQGKLTMLQYDQYPDMHDVPLEILCLCMVPGPPPELRQRTPFPTYAPDTPAATANPPSAAPVPASSVPAPEPVQGAVTGPAPASNSGDNHADAKGDGIEKGAAEVFLQDDDDAVMGAPGVMATNAPGPDPASTVPAPGPTPKAAAKGISNVGSSASTGGPKGVRGSSSGSTNVAKKKNKSAVSKGDPHFKTFAQKKFDFHGGCDLVLLQHSTFANKLGLDINIRTKINSWWSYIDSAVIRIGKDKLEVTGGEDGGKHWINGKPGSAVEHGDSFTLSGYMVHVKQLSPKQKHYRVDLGSRNAISLETYKDFVAVNVNVKYDSMFVGSRGLMGSYPDGQNLARDGVTILEDAITFGKEWQVLDSEPMLFHIVEGPQHPEACAMPSTTQAAVEARQKRRLGEAGITMADAKIACAHAKPEEKDACVFDVLATQDKDLAGSY